MRVLFYLPVVTPWWFEHVVEPIIRRITMVAEVHVLAPVPWRNTGVGPEQLLRCADLARVCWHLVVDEGHTSLRTAAADQEAVIAFVRGLAPDLTLCRSADFDTTRRFPGIVRYIMEIAASPFYLPGCTASIIEQPFFNGAMPTLDRSELEHLDALVDPLWAEMEDHLKRIIPARHLMFEELGIDDDRPMLVMPLEYEHEENFFLHHRQPPLSTEDLVAQTAKMIGPECTLLVTDHPLNDKYVDRNALHDAISCVGENVALSPSRLHGVPATLALTRHASGLLLGDSKSFGLAALFQIPMLRRSRFASAAWLNAHDDLDVFVSTVREGQARAPSLTDARRWFAFHLANETFDIKDPALTGDELIDRAIRPVDPGRWAAGIARARAFRPEQAR